MFKVHELRGFVEVMADRGVRMRRGLDDYVGELRYRDDGGREDGGEDEIELEAKEMRRRMPY